MGIGIAIWELLWETLFVNDGLDDGCFGRYLDGLYPLIDR